MNELVLRANQVQQELSTIRTSLVKSSLRLGRLLREVVEQKYYQTYGHGSFEGWLETSGLELGKRSAYYLIETVKRQEQLAIPDHVIESAGFSKAKEILTLGAEEASDEQVLKLLEEAPNATAREIKDKVDQIKGKEDVVMHFKVDRIVRDEVILPAFESIRIECSDEVSDSRALELLCLAQLAGASAALPPIEAEAEAL